MRMVWMKGNPCDVYGAAGIGFYRGCGTGKFFASGTCLALGKDVCESLGGFDEKLFLYHDNVDTVHEVVGLFHRLIPTSGLPLEL